MQFKLIFEGLRRSMWQLESRSCWLLIKKTRVRSNPIDYIGLVQSSMCCCRSQFCVSVCLNPEGIQADALQAQITWCIMCFWKQMERHVLQLFSSGGVLCCTKCCWSLFWGLLWSTVFCINKSDVSFWKVINSHSFQVGLDHWKLPYRVVFPSVLFWVLLGMACKCWWRLHKV